MHNTWGLRPALGSPNRLPVSIGLPDARASSRRHKWYEDRLSRFRVKSASSDILGPIFVCQTAADDRLSIDLLGGLWATCGLQGYKIVAVWSLMVEDCRLVARGSLDEASRVRHAS